MSDSNNTPSRGCSYESNKIYLKEIRPRIDGDSVEVWLLSGFGDRNNITRSQRICGLMKRYYTRWKGTIYTSSLQF